ncbi:hypothetical protein KIN20_035193 [Parelaphostrongylus tenuis]|uniref:Uncharacterized protein n=1 Tax=Parelaphostrongylus tenuis TaxID=148309 RepID=A0AAD5RDU8_PARTN|nr:hypothetical protein KIN20_035193 [Parelaphostrongylus tenuis]
MYCILLFVVSVVFGATRDYEGFCHDYLECMQQLEEKQSNCLRLEQNITMTNSDSCTRRRWKLKITLHGLHLRRAELARDCVQIHTRDAKISQSTLTSEEMDSCLSVRAKFAFARVNQRKIHSSNQSRKSDVKKALMCRRDTKLWHKNCSHLAKCCPLTLDCKLTTKEIMEQIYEERTLLRELNSVCN